jgi:hypothetical protein
VRETGSESDREPVSVAKAMLLTSNRGFAERDEVFGAAVVGPRLSTSLCVIHNYSVNVQNYSLDLRGINLAT